MYKNADRTDEMMRLVAKFRQDDVQVPIGYIIDMNIYIYTRVYRICSNERTGAFIFQQSFWKNCLSKLLFLIPIFNLFSHYNKEA
jgi:hypothetical protein